MATISAVKSRPPLHVEVRLKNVTGAFVRTDLVREEVSAWLARNFIHLKIDQEITDFESLNHGPHIASINVVDFSGPESETPFHSLQDVQLVVDAYELHNSDETGSFGQKASPVSEGEDEDSQSVHLRTTPLPSQSFVGIWDSLVFEQPIPARLLRFMVKMMSLTKIPQLNLSMLNWNRLLLLYGPPGSGKTSLCRALAQKLSIRMGRYFTQGKLIEINSNSLLSKWFGESGKLVSKLFDQIHAIADDETTLVCVLIDEVETLTGSREKAAHGHENSDALRATNQLLTALDRLRHRSNVMILCTSNLMTAIDPAFLDRVDIKQFIPNPSPRATYEILRSCCNELIRCGVMIPSEDPDNNVSEAGSHDSTSHVPTTMEMEIMACSTIPTLAEMNIHLWNLPNTPASKLWRIAEKCNGLSGRALRRLPFLALSLHTFTDICTVNEGLAALSIAVDEEVNRDVRERSQQEPSSSFA